MDRAAGDSRQARLARVRKRMREEGLAGLMVISAADCRYLTGFTGEAASVCVTAEDVFLFTDPRFTTQAEEQAPEARLVIFGQGADDEVPAAVLGSLGAAGAGGTPGSAEAPVLGVDPAHMTVRRWDRLRPLVEESGLRWHFAAELVEGCRQVKFEDELEALRASARLVSRAFTYLEEREIVGRTEREVALGLEMHLRELGSEGVAFPFIIAGGARGAMPHAEPSEAVIEQGQLVVFDLGIVVDGYASDITRTYATGGDIDEELTAAYEAVREAQAAAVAAARAGISGQELDSVARDYLEAAGLADRFVHSLGHGVGLEVHEGPTVSQRSQTTLIEGMVVTIEPGVYLPGKGGIRIEDTVIIHEDGAEVITKWPRELRRLH